MANRGQVLKGTKTNITPTPETEKKKKKNTHTEYPTFIPEKPNRKTDTHPTKSRRTCHRRVAGPMGRPALLGRRPGGPWYEGSENPTGTAPSNARTSIMPDNNRVPQKMLTQLFAGPVRLQGLQTLVAESMSMHQGTGQPTKKHNLPDSILYMITA